MDLQTVYHNSPIGLIKISGNSEYVSAILFCEEEIIPSQTSFSLPPISECRKQLDEYFEGKRKLFDFPMQQAGTDFQQSVWAALLQIPFGKTISYLELSKQIGNTKAIRAVGTANGRNALSIVVPCHRVIGSNGKLIGYSGGLARKKNLLLHEAAHTLRTTTLW